MTPWTSGVIGGHSDTAMTGRGGARWEKKATQSTEAPKVSAAPASSTGGSGSRKGAFRCTGPGKGARARSTAWATVWRR